ncbi:unnamed protein product [Candidula unifasciata]|uniref:Organic cation transporter-like protein 2 n=1 Tax=Candidula unifasciata TaxID=100452 RepID=A0A8S3Z4W0_9EUPU|nr:unnamed protein product [Candidula unifasciata]
MTDYKPSSSVTKRNLTMSSHFTDADSMLEDESDYREIYVNSNVTVEHHQHSPPPGGSERRTDGSEVIVLGYHFDRVVLVTHFNIFLYSCAFWIQQAVVPYLSKELGADPVIFGYLQTSFAVVQLAGGPLFGRFGDLFGSRLAMMLAFAASALSYFLLSVSTNLPLLFLSRLPSVFMHAMQGGQMIVTDISSSEKRADAIGKLGISYGIGMVIGPVIGGLLARMFSLDKAAIVACLLSIISILITYICVPVVTKRAIAKDHEQNVFNVRKISQLLMAPGAMFLLCIKLATGVPIGIFQSMFSIVALDTFKLSAEHNSYIMSYIGVMAMLVQGVGIGIVTKKLSELNILFGSACILVVGYLLLSLVTTIWQMCLVFIPLIMGLTFQNVLTTSALTHTVSDSDTGAMLGLSMAVNSFIRSLSPTVGGYMLREFGFKSFGYLGFITSSLVVVVLFVKKQNENH